MHEGIASRTFRGLGPVGAPVRVVHDGVSDAVYGGLRRALRAAPRGGARWAARRADPQAPALASRVSGSIALGALNGLYGNHLAAGGSELALALSVRRHGADIPLTPDGLASAFPDATSRIAVFVHGLCETGLARTGAAR